MLTKIYIFITVCSAELLFWKFDDVTSISICYKKFQKLQNMISRKNYCALGTFLEWKFVKSIALKLFFMICAEPSTQSEQ